MKPVEYSVSWSRWALIDLESIIDYIAEDNLNNAETVYLKIKESAVRVEKHPEIGKVVPELKSHKINIYREVIASHWRIIYKISDENVDVMAVIDSRRDIDDTLISRMINRSISS
jgi:addiction module RelE/StbE family toxin